MLSNDANPFAGYEPNTAADQEDPGGDFNLAGAAGRAARTGSVFGGCDQDTTAFPPPWPGLELNPIDFRAEAQHGANAADATDPPLPEGRETVEQEPEDHSAELLRRVLAGNRETDISRVKLAKMPTPTGSRGLPPVKAWQDWFTIRLRTWANVISPEFEAELVKKVQGQQADLSRHGAADRQLAHEICFNIDDKMRRSIVGLRDPESTAQRNPGQHGRAHDSASREVCQARPLQGQDEAVVDAETMAYRPQGVSCRRQEARHPKKQ